MGTGMLPLRWAVMRFPLGCLDRKSQLKDAKSLPEPQQPPAPAQTGAYRSAPTPAPTVLPGGHQHQHWPGAPAGCAGQQLHHLFTPLPPAPAPHCHWCGHPMPRLGVPGTPLRTSGCVPPPCPPCHLPGHTHQHPSAAHPPHSPVRPWHCGIMSAGPMSSWRHHAVP